MIAADTSTWIAFFQGAAGEDVALLSDALESRQLLMVPAVLTELLSDPSMPPDIAASLLDIPQIDPEPGYWQRAGELRSKVLARRLKARLGDALIAQSCLDRAVPLLTRDRDFRRFSETSGLNLVV